MMKMRTTASASIGVVTRRALHRRTKVPSLLLAQQEESFGTFVRGDHNSSLRPHGDIPSCRRHKSALWNNPSFAAVTSRSFSTQPLSSSSIEYEGRLYLPLLGDASSLSEEEDASLTTRWNKPSPVPENEWDTFFKGETSRHVITAQELAAQVEQHYELDKQDGTASHFVGGMGESDLGVCFVSPPSSTDDDPLQHWQLIQETIALVKESRHGVPFSLVTSGCHVPSDMPHIAELGLSNVEVLLLASSPPDYAAVTGLSPGEAATCFGQVCGFIVHASETGFPVICGVAGGPSAGSASELAKALGAIDVHIYDISK